MSTSYENRFGQVYKRKRKRGKEDALKKAMKAMGVGSPSKLLNLASDPDRSVRPRRGLYPSLGVCTYTWTANGQPMTVGEGGSVFLFTLYSFGNADYQRHSNETLTYKMQLLTRSYIESSYWKRCLKSRLYWWLIYYAAPTGTLPTTTQSFSRYDARMPGLWMINRDVCHRFIIKEKWNSLHIVNGIDPSKDAVTVSGASALGYGSLSEIIVDKKKFVSRLGIKTEWKNVTSDDIADIKNGALYLVVAHCYDLKFCIHGQFSIYFKSVGNQ
ncbi:hypothetical protein Pfo_009082 [Paulownia fortunei]|nr:hypothetical protein Pfo_009082 [Paulownia fortunei]